MFSRDGVHLLAAEQAQIITNYASGTMGFDDIVDVAPLSSHHRVCKSLNVLGCVLFNILTAVVRGNEVSPCPVIR